MWNELKITVNDQVLKYTFHMDKCQERKNKTKQKQTNNKKQQQKQKREAEHQTAEIKSGCH